MHYVAHMIGGTIVDHQNLDRSRISLARDRVQRFSYVVPFVVGGDQDRDGRRRSLGPKLRPSVQGQAGDEKGIYRPRDQRDTGYDEQGYRPIGQACQIAHPRQSEINAEGLPSDR